MTYPQTTSHVTVFATDWCPYCRALLNGLKSLNVDVDVVDVDDPANQEASDWVASVNNGNRIVPTVLYSDGTHATNPPAEKVAKTYAKLSA